MLQRCSQPCSECKVWRSHIHTLQRVRRGQRGHRSGSFRPFIARCPRASAHPLMMKCQSRQHQAHRAGFTLLFRAWQPVQLCPGTGTREEKTLIGQCTFGRRGGLLAGRCPSLSPRLVFIRAIWSGRNGFHAAGSQH